MRHLLWILSLALLAGCTVPRASAPSDADVIAAAQAWADVHNSRDPARIVAMYAPDATFWGTIAKTLATTPAGVLDFYAEAPTRPQARVRFDSHHVQFFDGVAIDSGAYTFMDVRDGAAISIPARFTMVFQQRGGRWVLVHHHSSRTP